jgi:hypothetical protein
VTSVLDGALERGPFAGEGGRTGASFERAVLADGTNAVIKFVSRDDWMLIVGGGVSYLNRLWKARVFERMPRVIDHAMLAMEPADDGFVLVMRDVSDAVLAEGRVLSRAENRRVLAAVDEMYREFWGEDLPGCPLYDHFVTFNPFNPALAAELEKLDTPIPRLMRRGWGMFGDVAPPDVTGAMRALLDDPGPLVRELEKRPMTLIHGDLRLHNIGLSPDRVVLLDWEIAGVAPPAVEFGWYLIISASRIDATREQITDDFRDICGDRFDAHALELGMISALLSLGWNKAIDILEHSDPAIRAQERADLDWWIARVRTALEAWSPV